MSRKFYKLRSAVILSLTSLLGIVGIIFAKNERIQFSLLALGILVVLYFGMKSTLTICDKENGFTESSKK